MSLSTALYQNLIKPALFSLEPEKAHKITLKLGKIAQYALVQKAVEYGFQLNDKRLNVNTFGLHFDSPIGMAAGLDKDCGSVPLMSSLGFGFLELGGVTAKPQNGNPGPRVFRIPEHQAIINRLGLPSVGAAKAAKNLLMGLAETRNPPPIAVNIAKSHSADVDQAIPDYLETFSTFYDLCDLFVLNVSCPNEENYQRLQEKDRLTKILEAFRDANKKKKPFLVKFSPDLTEAQLDDALDCCQATDVSGVISGNTTTSRPNLNSIPNEKGGLSGRPLFKKSLAQVRYISRRMGKNFPVIGCGGISDSAQIIEMIKAGASLVQIYTALIYGGPGLVKELKLGILKQMEKDGVNSLEQYRASAFG